MKTAIPVVQAVRAGTLTAKGRDPAPVRYYPAAGRLEHRPADGVPQLVLLWVKALFADGPVSLPAVCRWDGVKWELN